MRRTLESFKHLLHSSGLTSISSARPNCVYSVTILAIRKIVEAVLNLCVGREVGQKGVEVVLVGALSSVITLVIDTEVVLESWLGVGL